MTFYSHTPPALDWTPCVPLLDGIYWWRSRRERPPALLWVEWPWFGVVGATGFLSRLRIDAGPIGGEWAGPLPQPEEETA